VVSVAAGARIGPSYIPNRKNSLKNGIVPLARKLI
jgi:hypothetical protein